MRSACATSCRRSRTTKCTRYSRHLIMPEVGVEGQRKLKAARVLCVGAGGLGSPASLYLAAAGVGTLGLVDFDVVDVSNLQRQILYSTTRRRPPQARRGARAAHRPQSRRERRHARDAADVGERARHLPATTTSSSTARTTSRRATSSTTRACCSGKPNVYGSIFRFDGQASVFATKGGPCYRCLYPEPPPPGLVPSCAEGGVLGVLPGIIGTIQATEAIKLILGAGESLVGRLLLFDALTMQFRTLKLRRDPDCPVCGDHPTITTLIDYEQFCGITPAATRRSRRRCRRSSRRRSKSSRRGSIAAIASGSSTCASRTSSRSAAFRARR